MQCLEYVSVMGNYEQINHLLLLLSSFCWRSVWGNRL